jgi:hypothetical protein
MAESLLIQIDPCQLNLSKYALKFPVVLQAVTLLGNLFHKIHHRI